ncbi:MULTISPECIES: surface-adhesin E family protein [Achromobacter]|uniref:Surface-adhesin protein E-like domain-containing protein n=1 Tax=Achromobacter aegrifaciens TaxID=1287736 RepID=A0AAD2J0J4_ACHAE|nr:MULTISPECIES: surface-adhesin E family protein [Achromobacter]PTN49798.1 hypothetical protein DAI43_21135 [Achromobacter xylosoxidans]MBD9380015.1 hypothetical protein [Achromobacter sp. ACM02]MBD9418403.1 hypothetical protein [Achromobacter sp. ACM04]MBD9428786.1 hypothetical protein [Achromobacter sp. ACM03]MBD9473470.1 hypothetical protein [Achromobacter sp. ACM01]
MTARHAFLIALAVTAWVHPAQAAPPGDMPSAAAAWLPLDPQAMPGVFYDSASIKVVSERPAVMAVNVAWFYAQPKISAANGQPYRSVIQPVTMNCTAGTYTVSQVVHHAGENATGPIVESLPPPGIRNAPIAQDPVQRKLREIVCPVNGKGIRR